MKQLTAVIVGYGHRSRVYTEIALKFPEQLKIVALVDTCRYSAKMMILEIRIILPHIRGNAPARKKANLLSKKKYIRSKRIIRTACAFINRVRRWSIIKRSSCSSKTVRRLRIPCFVRLSAPGDRCMSSVRRAR